MVNMESATMLFELAKQLKELRSVPTGKIFELPDTQGT